jgi:hypothetical protein
MRQTMRRRDNRFSRITPRQSRPACPLTRQLIRRIGDPRCRDHSYRHQTASQTVRVVPSRAFLKEEIARSSPARVQWKSEFFSVVRADASASDPDIRGWHVEDHCGVHHQSGRSINRSATVSAGGDHVGITAHLTCRGRRHMQQPAEYQHCSPRTTRNS